MNGGECELVVYIHTHTTHKHTHKEINTINNLINSATTLIYSYFLPNITYSSNTYTYTHTHTIYIHTYIHTLTYLWNQSLIYGLREDAHHHLIDELNETVSYVGGVWMAL